jgi:TetR/AcrR family transcriptional repressor of bet genes
MTTALIDKPETRAPRKASRESRREQLIEATIETIAANGLSRTTLTEVANAAGLSHGLVNFHFQSKDRLLAETLQYLSEEYRGNWTRALAAAGPAPAERLDALIRADYVPAISTPARLKAWCAFWGEAQSRPVYQETCGANDRAYVRTLEGVCAALGAEAGLRHDAARVARILRVTIEGTWLDRITMAEPYSREEALATAYTCTAAFFPGHFDAGGLIGRQA